MIDVVKACKITLNFGDVAYGDSAVSVNLACFLLKAFGHFILRKEFLYRCRVYDCHPSVAVSVSANDTALGGSGYEISLDRQIVDLDKILAERNSF